VSLSREGALIGLVREGTEAFVRMAVVGADVAARGAGVGRVAGRSNYLTGSDPRRWQRNVPSYEQVRYDGVYPGIDMIYRSVGDRLEYDFLVAAGADPAAIVLRFTGGKLSLARNGDLLVRTRGGTLREKRPFVYQRIAGERRRVEGRYVLRSGGRVTFKLGDYDRSRLLVIDPQVVYSTYLGGGPQGEGMGGFGPEAGRGIAVDSTGNAYVTGSTAGVGATAFPTSGPFQSTSGGGVDAFVTKLNPSGSGLVYSTYLGGGGNDRAYDIAVNSEGEAYVTGETASTGATPFPTNNAIQSTNAGGANDVFVAKLNAAGNDLVWSTYLGGPGNDRARGIAVDASGSAYLAGYAAAGFPTANAFDETHNGGDDAFVAKLPANGSELTFSTFLGGAGNEGAEGIVFSDATQDAYITGATASAEYPTTAGAFQTTGPGGTSDAFVSRLEGDGTALAYSTFLGGAARDAGVGIAIDGGGAAYVTGATGSDDFPVQGALQAARKSLATIEDGFVTKLNAAGSGLVYSTYLGGAHNDQGNAIAVDSTGAAYIGGVSDSHADFPQAAQIGVGAGNSDAFITKLSPSGATAAYSSLLGGSDGDTGFAIDVDDDANAYLVGQANHFAAPPGNYPTTAGAFQSSAPGGSEAFVTKIASSPSAPLVTSLRSRSGPATGGTEVTIGGIGLSGATAVRFGDTPATSFSVQSDTRIRAISPAHGLGRTRVRVATPGGVSPANPAATFEYAEGTWTLTGSLNDSHFAAPLVALEDGRVLLPSGISTRGGPTIGSSELYDPKTRSWTKTADIGTSRHAHTATLLDGPSCRSVSPPAHCGKVLVAGGYPLGVTGNQPVLDSAELYDPKTRTWAPTGAMNVRRALHPAILLDGPTCHTADPPAYCGKVLAVGGRTCNQPAPATCATMRTNTAELYDPVTGTWTTTGSMVRERSNLDLAILPDGMVLAGGGFGTGASTTAEVYDPATGGWDATGGTLRSRTRASAAMLDDGRVLATSGFGAGNTSDIYDPATRLWSPAADMITAYRFNYDYAKLPSGKVIFAGGGSGGETSEAYDPDKDAWVSTGLMNVSRGYSGDGITSRTVVLSSDPARFAADAGECGDDCGKVLMAGDTDDRTAELYTPPPVVRGLDTTSGPAGTPVTVRGQGFTHGVR
ncbi:MAG TPA: SBBP repeat-containing protein, partial [Solirubrobacteraceae bacterium]|nr:SBBP repeat-containing protein [Solirubrobacteraceae bacterium]